MESVPAEIKKFHLGPLSGISISKDLGGGDFGLDKVTTHKTFMATHQGQLF